MLDNKGDKKFDVARLSKYIESVEWRYAKTMPQCPHFYTKRIWDKTGGEEFAYLEKAIADNCVEELFNNKTKFYYFYFEGFKYWGGPWLGGQMILINRAKVEPDTKE